MTRPTESRREAGTSRQHVAARPGDDRVGSSSSHRDDRPGRSRAARAVIGAFCVLIFAMAAGVSIGPASIPLSQIAGSLIAHLPWHPATGVPRIDSAIVWQIRFPRVVLGALVGAMLAGGGAAYQGVFRNPLADPYLLGIAAGAGLGATVVIISGGSPSLPPAESLADCAAAVISRRYSHPCPTPRGRFPAGGARRLGTAMATYWLALGRRA